MIRVIYRWTVDPEQAEAFVAAWREATRCIQQAFPGARGSVLLRSQGEPNVHIALARWDSVDAWKASRQSDVAVVPAAVIQIMMAAATGPASYEILDEVLDWASPGAAETVSR